MNEKDKKTFLEDFTKADISKKLDMWFFAIEQEGLWDEILAEMSMIGQSQNKGQKTSIER